MMMMMNDDDGDDDDDVLYVVNQNLLEIGPILLVLRR